MESLGLRRFKRNELSFKKNSARGLNCREDRLLESALGSIEKERQRSLNAIVNEVHSINDSLKETVTVKRNERSQAPVVIEHGQPKSQVACSRSREDLNCKNNNYLNSAERGEESIMNPDYHSDLNFPSIKGDSSGPVPAIKRMLTRRRNISTGSIPSDSHYDNGKISHRSVGSPLATRSRLSDASNNYYNESTSYLTSESGKHGVQSTNFLASEFIGKVRAHSLDQVSIESTSYLDQEITKPTRQSIIKAGSRSMNKLSNESTSYLASETAKVDGLSMGKLMESSSKSTESLDGKSDQVKLFHRRNAWMKRTISADNITAIIPNEKHPNPTRRITYASYGTSPVPARAVAIPSPARQRKFATSAESSPLLLRRGLTTEKNINLNHSYPQVAGHKRVTRMVSCPQIGLGKLESEFQTLKCSDALPILRSKTEFPELVHDNTDDNFAYDSSKSEMSVSPKNNYGSHMDKNLQHRINSFLESLPGKEVEDYDEP